MIYSVFVTRSYIFLGKKQPTKYLVRIQEKMYRLLPFHLCFVKLASLSDSWNDNSGEQLKLSHSFLLNLWIKKIKQLCG